MRQQYAKPFSVQWIILAIAIAVLGALIAYNLCSSRASTETREQARLLTQVRVIGENLGRQLESTDSTLKSVRDELALAPHHDHNDHMRRLVRALAGVRTILVTDAAGNIRFSNRPELIGRNFSHRDYFERPRRNPDPNILFVSPPFNTVLGARGLSLTHAITGRNGEFAGVVAATLDAEYFATLLESVRYTTDMRAVVIHGEGSVFQTVPEAPQVTGKNVAQPGSFFSRHLASGQTESVFAGTTAAASENRMLALRTIKPAQLPMDVPLIAVVSRNHDAVFEIWRAEAYTYGGIFLASALLSVLALIAFQKRQRVQIEQIEVADALLRQERANLANAQKIAHIGSWELDLASNRLSWSDEIFRLFEIDKTQFPFTYEGFLDAIHPDDRDTVARAFSDSLLNRQPYEITHRLRMGDGRIKWVHERGMSDYDAAGKPTRSAGTVQDITERKVADDALRASEQRQRMLLDHAADAVLIAGPDELWTYVNDQATELLGFSREEIVGTSIYDIVPPDSRDLYRQEFANLRGSNQVWARELRLLRKDGSKIPVDMNAVQLPDGSVYGSCRDISARRKAEEDQRIAAIAFETQEGMLVTDSSGTILRVNHAFTEMTGYSAAEAIGNTPAMLQSGRQDSSFYRRLWQTLAKDKYWEGEVWNRRKNGEIYPEWLTITAVSRPNGKVTHYVAVFSDITERKAAEEQIRSLAFYDPLTKLANRRLLIDRCEQALRACARRKNHGAILILDLDRFKTLNDTHGHDVGDLLLIEVAHRLLGCVRAEDTVARMGGDEFVVVLEELSPVAAMATEQARDVAEKIRAAIDAPYSLNGHAHNSSPSIGICLFDGNATSVKELLMHADKAMYGAKAAGRDTVRVFGADAPSAAG